jgi:hypothetical protein
VLSAAVHSAPGARSEAREPEYEFDVLVGLPTGVHTPARKFLSDKRIARLRLSLNGMGFDIQVWCKMCQSGIRRNRPKKAPGLGMMIR